MSEVNKTTIIAEDKRTDIKDYLPLLFLGILLIGIYYSVLTVMVETWWDDPNYSHGFLIPLVSAYLIWEKREKLNHKISHKSNAGLVFLLGGIGLCIVGTAAAEFFTVRFSFVMVILGIVFYLYGKNFVKETWFPILFLIFMIPIPYVIYYAVTFPMQILSTKAATALLQLFGFPILRQGNIIHLENYSLEVVEACSGLRSLMTLTALGAAMAYITQKTIFSSILLFLLSVPIAIGANVFRITITALGALWISPKFAEGFLHEVSGLVVFLVGFISLGIVGIVLNWIGNIKNYEPNF